MPRFLISLSLIFTLSITPALQAFSFAPSALVATGSAVEDAELAGQIASSAHQYNYLTHEEAVRRLELQEALASGSCEQEGNCAALQAELVALNALDAERDARLIAACDGGNAQACMAELSLIFDAYQSYHGITGAELVGSPIFGEYIQIGQLYGDMAGSVMQDSAVDALENIAIDSVTGYVDMAVVTTLALAGHAQAQEQLALMADALWYFIRHPISATEESIKLQLEHADALEAAGDIHGANTIRSEIFIAGAFSVLPIAAGTGATAAAGLRLIMKTPEVRRPYSGGSGADNAANAARLRMQLAAEEIASGHGFQKHVMDQNEFVDLGIQNRQQYQLHIENVLNNPSSVRYTVDGRSFHLQESTGTVVIRNPNLPDGGTAFRPHNWDEYVLQLPTRTEPY